MFHLQDVIRAPLDMLCDLVPVRGAKYQRAQNQHVQGALQQLNSFVGFFRHGAGRYSTQKTFKRVDALPTVWLGKGIAIHAPLGGSTPWRTTKSSPAR